MVKQRRQPGEVRDAIVSFLRPRRQPATVEEIRAGVEAQLGPVSPSSIRSYLNLNTSRTFERTGRGRYVLRRGV